MPAISQADRDLAGDARAKGAEVTDVQVASWRERGLIDKPRQVHLGRPGGSRAVYPPEALDQVIALAGLPRRQRTHDGLFILFGLGLAVSEIAFKGQFIVWYTCTRAAAGDDGDEVDRIERLATALQEINPAFANRVERRFRHHERARQAREEVAEPGEPADVLRTAVFTTAARALLTGEAPGDDETEEVIVAAGIDRLAPDPERPPYRRALVEKIPAGEIAENIDRAKRPPRDGRENFDDPPWNDPRRTAQRLDGVSGSGAEQPRHHPPIGLGRAPGTCPLPEPSGRPRTHVLRSQRNAPRRPPNSRVQLPPRIPDELE